VTRTTRRSSKIDSSVIRFPARKRTRGGPAQFRPPPANKEHFLAEPSKVADLSKYERNEESRDEYRHRMMINGIAFVINMVLIMVGTWLATNLPR
jgi:hypothetical protein